MGLEIVSSGLVEMVGYVEENMDTEDSTKVKGKVVPYSPLSLILLSWNEVNLTQLD